MHKILKLLLLIFFSCKTISIIAQNKYAVLVAVNDYYASPGVKSPHSLHGCVNDANAIKKLLINKFGFLNENIKTLYDSSVTKKNVIDLMQAMAQKCKKDDALVFYYSGHGVWMNNTGNAYDAVKHGRSQAIVMSNLYATNWDCLLRDETIKQMFNQFVDKKVILTSIFDCCFSANIPMDITLTPYWSGSAEDYVEKSLDLKEILYRPKLVKPSGCAIDALGRIIDSTDSDGDGVPDCKDWEYTYVLPADSLGIGGPLSGTDFLETLDNYYDSLKFLSGASDSTKSFNLKNTITIFDNTHNARPSERLHSRFLSLSATNDYSKGLEITDEAGRRHGAFTKALLEVYKTNSPNITAKELERKINDQMSQQQYTQGPTYHSDTTDPFRNFIGTNSRDFSKKLKAKCIGIKQGNIILDKGFNDGVAKGNAFAIISDATKSTIRIVKVYDDSSIAIDNSNGKIKQGQSFELTDNYAVSNPLIKLFIPPSKMNAEAFNNFFDEKIKPLVKLKKYKDYNTVDFDDAIHIFYNGINKFDKNSADIFYNSSTPLSCYVFLPIPSPVNDAIKKEFLKNQNIEFVTDVKKADYVLYLNYAKARPDKKAGFVFYFNPLLPDEPHGTGFGIFSEANAQFESLNVKGKELQTLSKKINDLAKIMIRYKTNNWLNETSKK